MVKKVFKYGTGQKVPHGAVYLYSTKNGIIKGHEYECYQYVWHYFLVEVENE